ncbi:MAG TPA: TetR/AcrR family transcriptional regulator [Roseiarcus sp.]|nr:TetR/AcrR family transcriptional regulator [Roseiarcus sp.]
MARQDDVVRAAIGVFLRYGYARTTMGDIAQAAGLTRPTLYLTFPGKERIFTAVVEKMIEDKLIEIRGGLPRQKSLETKLRFACNAWAAEGYELVKAHPDAADMFDLGFKSVCAGYDQFGALLAEILDEPLGRSSLELSARDAARAVVFAMRGFKDVATSGAEMRGLIETHVKLVAGAIEPKSGRSKEALPRRK